MHTVTIDIGSFSADTLFNMKMELQAERIIHPSYQLKYAIETIDSRLNEYYAANRSIKLRHDALETDKKYATYKPY